MTCLVAVLTWLGATVLRDRGRTFVAGVAVSGLLVLVALNLAAPDAIVARFNAGRVPVGALVGADVRHMADLSAEAVDVAIQATLDAPRSVNESLARKEEDRPRCVGAYNLMNR